MHNLLSSLRRILSSCGLAACLLALAGCPSAKPAGQAHGLTIGQPNAKVNSAQAAISGSAIALPLEIAADDEALLTLDLGDPRLMALARCIALPLIQSQGDGSQTAGLASNWSTTDKGTTWVLELKACPAHADTPGYLGELFVTHLKTVLHGAENPIRAQLVDLVRGAADYRKGASAELTGVQLVNNTLTITLTRPDNFFPAWVSQPALGVLENWDLGHAAGYGPWRVASFNPGDPQQQLPASIILEPNPDSLAGRPVAGQLTFFLEPSRVKQVELFSAGKLQAANVEWNSAPLAQQQFPSEFKHLESAVPSVGQFDLHQFPWGEDPFQSKRGLRQALNWALDREYLGETLNYQLTGWSCFFPKPLNDLNAPELLQKPTYPLGQDIPAAQDGLLQADHQDGTHLLPGMDLGYLRHTDLEAEVVELIRYWNEISVKMRPFAMNAAEQRLRLAQGTHEIIYRRLYPAYPAPDAITYPYLFGSLLGGGGNYWNQAQPGVDELIRNAQAATTTTDATRSYRELTRTLDREALLVLAGYYTPAVLISDKLAGVSLSPYDYSASLNMQDFTKLGLAQ